MAGPDPWPTTSPGWGGVVDERSIVAGQYQMRASASFAPITPVALAPTDSQAASVVRLAARRTASAPGSRMTDPCNQSSPGRQTFVGSRWLRSVVVVARRPREAPDPPTP
jgi:hypothetical protein